MTHRWTDWLVFMTTCFAMGLLINANARLGGYVAVAVMYGVGRWDESSGQKYRDMREVRRG